jgi:hypothetical protein
VRLVCWLLEPSVEKKHVREKRLLPSPLSLGSRLRAGACENSLFPLVQAMLVFSHVHLVLAPSDIRSQTEQETAQRSSLPWSLAPSSLFFLNGCPKEPAHHFPLISADCLVDDPVELKYPIFSL